MNTFIRRFVVGSACMAIALLGAPLAVPAAAQELPAPVGEFAAGALLFADDGVVTEGFAGGTVRLYLSPRISVGPEVAFIQGQNHSHLMLTGNVTFDLMSPVNGRLALVTPFAVVGGGLFQTREQFRETFTSYDGAFTAGGGVRVRVGRYVVAGAEARIGWELHLRLNGFIGVSFGER
jgi:hypothetical protein